MFIRKILIAALLLFGAGISFGESLTGVVINKSAQGIDSRDAVDLAPIESLSVQAVYDDGTPAAHTIIDGEKSYAVLTVSEYAGLTAGRAGMYITIGGTAVDAEYVTLNGVRFTEGVEWDAAATTALTAESLKLAVDAHPDFVSTRSGSIVYASATLVGIYANDWSAASSDPVTNIATSAVVFAGGVDANYYIINGVTLTEDTDWDAETSDAVTANNICDTINADATLSTVMVATSPTASALIYATSTVAGAGPYVIVTSTTGLAITTPFSVPVSGDIDVANDIVTKTSHGLTTGLAVVLHTISGTAPGGLASGTTYYGIKLDGNRYQLATTTTTAAAGTDIDITGITGSGQFDIAASTFSAGTAGFHWEVSNDGTNWSDLTGVTVNEVSIASVTYSAAGNSVWDFGSLNYRYLRMLLRGPTYGGLSVIATIHGNRTRN